MDFVAPMDLYGETRKAAGMSTKATAIEAKAVLVTGRIAVSGRPWSTKP
jgi:hypothetical protein